MLSLKIKCEQFLCAALLCLSALFATAYGQQKPEQTPTPPPQNPEEEVVRVNTELVQTDVMVFDKQGRFVDNLQREHFSLRIDGKPQPISFFERVTAGTVNEEVQLAAARGRAAATSIKDQAAPKPLDRGRTIFFFVDDLHLEPANVPRMRTMIQRFIDQEMGQNDQVAIASASGQIGFLQQVTDNKAVLRAALARLKPRGFAFRDLERPPMTEYQALNIERYDRDTTDYFVERMLLDFPGMGRDSVVEMVRGRARSILQQTSSVTINTLNTLGSLVRSAAPLTGRKLLFFISDGFFIDDRVSGTQTTLRRIVDAAARGGVVIYTIDARGLSTGMEDASTEVAFDPTGRLARANSGQLAASQEALYTLAADTGGRALLNSNEPSAAVTAAVKETSTYYLLAWRPEGEEQRGGKFRRIEVSLIGRPDLTVRVRRGFFDADATNPKPAKSGKKENSRPTPRSVDGDLRAAIGSLYPLTNLVTSLISNYVDVPAGGPTPRPILTTWVKVQSRELTFTQSGDKSTAALDIAGIVFNHEGKQAASFRDRINITSTSANTATRPDRPIAYNHQTQLTPGLYQVRVAIRDEQSGRTGSATQWIEIPDLTSRQLSMSSVFLGERANEMGENKSETDDLPQAPLSIDRRSSANSRLRFLLYIYNAARETSASSSASPDVALQIQVFRDNQPVLTTPLRKVATDGIADLARIPYAAELSLEGLPAGHYLLKITAIDRIAKTSTTQSVKFEIV